MRTPKSDNFSDYDLEIWKGRIEKARTDVIEIAKLMNKIGRTHRGDKLLAMDRYLGLCRTDIEWILQEREPG